MGPTIPTPGHEPTNHSPKLSLDDMVTAVVYVSTSLCVLRNRKHALLTGTSKPWQAFFVTVLYLELTNHFCFIIMSYSVY